ncbi:hypothetical protein [Speluncibacter jeojiensis]|uniref:Uncharacterized protein n=1 Tax=Speluncibacter jeojiensis TaxID=2710754 RepID=A0A9X4M538_9ACTN|nr:hypothetical protein [Corynebacteriales bacterium D3-21]
MKYVALQVLGMVLLVVGAQDVIHLLVDPDNSGPLGTVVDGFGPGLALGLTLTIVGVVLAGWARARANRDGHLR